MVPTCNNVLSIDNEVFFIENFTQNNYEEIFEGKESINIVPLNNIRTLVLNTMNKVWLKRSKRRLNMMDPKMDEKSEVFSYFFKPCYHIGMPGEKLATQITPEGHLFTGAAELEFFTGEDLEPISQRIWTLFQGYFPCVQYEIKREGFVYHIEAFQYWIGENNKSPPINFIKLNVKNVNSSIKNTNFSIGFEYGGFDHRSPEMRIKNRFNPFWKYEMTNNSAIRGNKIIYQWDIHPKQRWAKKGEEYQNPFLCFNRKRPVCIAQYSINLEINEYKNFTFKMPHTPILTSNQSLIDLLISSKYEDYFKKMLSYWKNAISTCMDITVPEDKISNACKSYLIHNLMCQNFISENEIEQVTNRLQYNQIWLKDAHSISLMFNLWNFPDVSKKILRYFLRLQRDNGNFVSNEGYMEGTGCALAGFGDYIKMTNDSDFACEIFPSVEKAVSYIKGEVLNDRFGLIPPSNCGDGALIVGRVTGYNIWMLWGLDGAITVAEAAGKKEALEDFKEFRNAYFNHFVKQLKIATERNQGIIPPGMDVSGGVHWDNLYAAYRDFLINPFDPIINSTFDYYRKNLMLEGLGSYESAIHLWLTERIAQTAVIRGEQENALKDFYSLILHTGSCHEGFEFCPAPYVRDYRAAGSLYRMVLPGWCDFPPHGKFGANFNTLLRMMLIREWNQSLHLFSVISPEWVNPGDEIKVKNSSTTFGIVNLTSKAFDDGINISFVPTWNALPKNVLLHLPFYTNVSTVLVDGIPVSYDEGYVDLPLYDCNVDITWEINTSINYSYEKSVEDYKDEYKSNFKQKI